MMSQVRVLLADDHQIIVEGLRSLLTPEFDVVGAVGDGRTLVTQAVALQPDVMVVDISLPLLNGIEAIRHIIKAVPHARIVVLTMHPEVIYAIRAFDAGALGYVVKHSASTELRAAIEAAMKGEMYVSPRIAKALFKVYREGDAGPYNSLDILTPRQREVLQLVAEGATAKEVAAQLRISPRTVEYHKYRVMAVLDVKTNADLVQYAIKAGLVVT
jgi:DNA-binding NarL/FixJ family response regulator